MLPSQLSYCSPMGFTLLVYVEDFAHAFDWLILNIWYCFTYDFEFKSVAWFTVLKDDTTWR